MTRTTRQRGHVSEPFWTEDGREGRHIRYRVPTGEHKNETLYDMTREQAQTLVMERIMQAWAPIAEMSDFSAPASNQTLRQFTDRYFPSYLDRIDAKPSTRAGYESNLRNHIFPELGDLPLSELERRPLHIEAFLQSKAKLAAKTQRNLIALLQSILSLAVENDVIVRSPIKKKHKPKLRPRRRTAWDAKQVQAILHSVQQEYRALFFCLALTGARLGEVLALRWCDIDLTNRTIFIRNGLWHGKLQSPKTEESVRQIPFAQHLADVLAAHRRQSSAVAPGAFVFCKDDGGSLHPDVLRKDVLYPTLDRLGIARPARISGFHAFRHAAGSFVNSETGNLKLAQALLGHSNIGTTADVYTHTSSEAEREAAVALERAIFRESPTDESTSLFHARSKRGTETIQ